MAQHTARVVFADGSEGRLKIKKIRQHEALTPKPGFWVDGIYVFHRVRAEATAVRHSPVVGRIVSRRVDEFSGHDSGFSTAPYPAPRQCSGDLSRRYPVLSRVGAGL